MKYIEIVLDVIMVLTVGYAVLFIGHLHKIFGKGSSITKREVAN